MAADPELDIRALGPLEVDVRGHPAGLGGPKQRAVLSALALRSGATVSVEDLVAVVWGEDADVSDGLAALRVYVSNLRSILDPGRSSGPGSRIVRDGSGYRLRVEPDESDLLRFASHISSGRRSALAGQLAAAAESLRAAEALWRGRPCPELADALCVQPDLAALDELHLAAMEDRFDVEMALGRHAELVSEVLMLVRAQPLRERARAQLMLALYRCGRQQEALSEYLDLRETLASAVGVDPTPAVQALHRAILRQEPALDPPRPAVPAGAVVHHVPAAPNELIGRRSDVDRVVARLRRSRGRILTLVGPGGVGKSRLALAAAATVEPDYTAGACWVPLAALTDPALVPRSIATGLGLSGAADQDPAAAVSEHLAAHDVLLVLDNLEHLLPAAVHIAELLARLPELSVLATSRCALGLSAELEEPVAPLPVSDRAGTTVHEVRQQPAARLFVARAQAIDPNFALDDRTAPSVAAICRRLDGLPLAIELAATRIRVLSPEAISARLDRALQLLTTGAGDLPSRQQTLRATLEWSYRLLAPAERLLLNRLGIFSGGARVCDIEAVCGPVVPDIEVLDGLEALARHSLVQLCSDAGGEPRPALLETVREFSLEQLNAEGRHDELSRRHAEHYASQAERFGHALAHGRAQEAAVSWLRSEQDNLRQALHWCTRAPDRRGTGLRLVAGLAPYWEITSSLTEGLGWCHQLLADDLDPSTPAAAEAYGAAGTLAWLQEDYDTARAWHRRALDLQERSGDQAGVAWSLVCIATQDLSQGHIAEGEDLLQRALALAEATGDERVHRSALHSMGALRLLQGDARGAIPLTERSLAMARQVGDERAASLLLINLGEGAKQLGDIPGALALMQEGLATTQRLGDLTAVASCLSSIAEVALVLEAPDRALRLLAVVSAMQEVTGLRRMDLDESAIGPVRTAAFEALGAAAGAAAWAEGLTIGIDRAVQEALTLRPPPSVGAGTEAVAR